MRKHHHELSQVAGTSSPATDQQLLFQLPDFPVLEPLSTPLRGGSQTEEHMEDFVFHGSPEPSQQCSGSHTPQNEAPLLSDGTPARFQPDFDFELTDYDPFNNLTDRNAAGEDANRAQHDSGPSEPVLKRIYHPLLDGECYEMIYPI
jgi:hypothetical protein